MRQHRIRHKEEIIEANFEYIAQDPKTLKGRWRSLFEDGAKRPLFIEIGSGKGRFITTLAEQHQDKLYLACEGGLNIYPRILQKAAEKELKNLRLISEYIIEPAEYFAPGELSGIFINFCDPWQKKRYESRRLTHVSKLEAYKTILQSGAALEFKTDNDELFDFTLLQLKEAGLMADYITRDLHSSELAAENIMTEYEEKFSRSGKAINYLRVVF